MRHCSVVHLFFRGALSLSASNLLDFRIDKIRSRFDFPLTDIVGKQKKFFCPILNNPKTALESERRLVNRML